ncbi:MAG: VCBS repeat-containing protein, partial [Pirellula sp.]
MKTCKYRGDLALRSIGTYVPIIMLKHKVISVIWIAALFGCQAHSTQEKSESESGPLSTESIATIEKFCGDCHNIPLPSTFPKANWPQEVKQGFDFYIDSNRSDLQEPVRQDVVRYFQDAAPDRIVVPRADQMIAPESSVRFLKQASIPPGADSPATAQISWRDTDSTICFSDMREGSIMVWSGLKNILDPAGGKLQTLLTGKNICKFYRMDWDRDGIEDVVAGEMGSFPVGDHQNGRVSLWLGTQNGSYKLIPLAEKLGRVVEAVPFDYDEDGDLDVLVAEFGWRKTGALKLLRNVGGSSTAPLMEVETIDPRHGALGVSVADIDGDSKQDFIVAYGQEFETVDVYYNRGAGSFDRTTIAQLIDPSYNSSSFRLVDLDKDGRIDVVHTCGDAMDALIAKPYHGLRWIRNLGERR